MSFWTWAWGMFESDTFPIPFEIAQKQLNFDNLWCVGICGSPSYFSLAGMTNLTEFRVCELFTRLGGAAGIWCIINNINQPWTSLDPFSRCLNSTQEVAPWYVFSALTLVTVACHVRVSIPNTPPRWINSLEIPDSVIDKLRVCLFCVLIGQTNHSSPQAKKMAVHKYWLITKYMVLNLNSFWMGAGVCFSKVFQPQHPAIPKPTTSGYVDFDKNNCVYGCVNLDVFIRTVTTNKSNSSPSNGNSWRAKFFN